MDPRKRNVKQKKKIVNKGIIYLIINSKNGYETFGDFKEVQESGEII